MKIAAFLQLYNEHENGNLIRCLENCKQWSDEIFIYDDASTDGSQSIYTNYTPKDNIIFGKEKDFTKELFHKQELLNLVLGSKNPPDWIGWIDGDTILSKWYLTGEFRHSLEEHQRKGYDAIKVHNLNLWRDPSFYRKDNMFDDLWHVVFWRNTGKLSYNPSVGLHRAQYPDGLGRHAGFFYNRPLIHFGFASEINIVRKYLTYKSLGQVGWSLDRLIDEVSSFSLEKVPLEWFPIENIPENYHFVKKPEPITFNEYRNFNNWDEYIQSKVGISTSTKVVKTEVIQEEPKQERKPTVTIVGMIYKSMSYLSFMIENIKKYCVSDKYYVDYLIVANDATERIIKSMNRNNINHIEYNDPKPNDYYLNRVYRAWNYGGMHASGDIVVFINSDMAFSPGWLDKLLDKLTPDTIPCSRLVESGKLESGLHAISMNFGRSTKEYNEKAFLKYAYSINSPNKIENGGLYMPCAFYRKDFVESGGYPEGNVGSISGDDYFFRINKVMKNKQHITAFDSIVYHIQEGEKDG